MSSKAASGRLTKQLARSVLIYLSNNPHCERQRVFANSPDIPSKTLYDRLRYLEKKGYITHREDTYAATSKAASFLSETFVWDLHIHTPHKWAHQWHFVIFDIPKDKRRRRDAFRLRLKELGLVMYQNSVWIYPHPCEEIISQICTFYHLSKHVSYITAEKISGKEKFLKQFKLQE